MISSVCHVSAPLRRVRLLITSLAATCGMLVFAEVREMNLADVFAQIERDSSESKLAAEAVEQARAAVDYQRVGLLPDVSFELQQRRSRSASLSGGVATGSLGSRYDGYLNAQWDLLNPAQIAGYQAAREGVNVAGESEQARLQSVLSLAGNLYFQHLRNLSRMEVIDANITRAQALLDLANRQLNAGVATQIDVTRAETQLALAQQARLQQETEVATTELALKRLLAIPASGSFHLQPSTLVESAKLEEPSSVERPDLRLQQRLLSQSELEVKAARWNRLPTLSLTATYGEASPRMFKGDTTKSWSTELALSVPIFDGAETRSLTRTARSRLRASETQLADKQREVDADIQLALQNLHSREAQVKVAQRANDLAEDEFTLAQSRLENGVADNREMIEAQTRIAEAADNLVEARFQSSLAKLQLAGARGEIRDALPKEDQP